MCASSTSAASRCAWSWTAACACRPRRGCPSRRARLGPALVAELVLYYAPHILGDTGRGMFKLPVGRMDGRAGLEIVDVRAVGEDWRIIANVKASSKEQVARG